LLNELGRSDEADAALAPMLASNPPVSIRLRTAVMLPAIPISIEEIHRSRARLESTLEELLRSSERIVDPIVALNSIPFYLAYAGLNDRQILEKLAAVHRHLCPSLNFTAPHVQRGQERRPRRGRIRLGVISTNLFAHTIGRLNVGLIEHVDRSRFELFVLENSIDDPIANRVRAAALVRRDARADRSRRAGCDPLSRHRHGPADLLSRVRAAGAAAMRHLGASAHQRPVDARLFPVRARSGDRRIASAVHRETALLFSPRHLLRATAVHARR
jgi:hypothetical protein